MSPPNRVVQHRLPGTGMTDTSLGIRVAINPLTEVAMPQAWSTKRERQYEHIKSGAQKHGASSERASEIAARTVNKNRAQSGESRQASRTSVNDVSPQHRGGKRSHQGSGGP